VGYAPDVRHLSALAKQVQADTLVLGLPLNMDGSQGFQTENVVALAEKHQEARLSIVLQDERLTTSSANRSLIEGGMRREKRKNTVDMVAAAIILQAYLDSQN
jgi:putative Holliday junction resolvase